MLGPAWLPRLPMFPMLAETAAHAEPDLLQQMNKQMNTLVVTGECVREPWQYRQPCLGEARCSNQILSYLSWIRGLTKGQMHLPGLLKGSWRAGSWGFGGLVHEVCVSEAHIFVSQICSAHAPED